MRIAEIIQRLRAEQALSQKELVQRLFVTRQAVSKWERGKATPDIDTFLRINKEFGIPISTLMGAPERLLCQSCGMPLERAEDIAQGSDGAANPHYCRWCYAGDGFTHPSTMEEMVEEILGMPEHWPSVEAGRRFLRAQLPELERWKDG